MIKFSEYKYLKENIDDELLNESFWDISRLGDLLSGKRLINFAKYKSFSSKVKKAIENYWDTKINNLKKELKLKEQIKELEETPKDKRGDDYSEKIKKLRDDLKIHIEKSKDTDDINQKKIKLVDEQFDNSDIGFDAFYDLDKEVINSQKRIEYLKAQLKSEVVSNDKKDDIKKQIGEQKEKVDKAGDRANEMIEKMKGDDKKGDENNDDNSDKKGVEQDKQKLEEWKQKNLEKLKTAKEQLKTKIDELKDKSKSEIDKEKRNEIENELKQYQEKLDIVDKRIIKVENADEILKFDEN